MAPIVKYMNRASVFTVCLAILAITFIYTGPAMAGPLLKFKSSQSVAETMDRFISVVGDRGIPVVLRINHAAEGAAAGVDIPDQELLIWGVPMRSAMLISKRPPIGIDLPLRTLVWEDEDGQVWIGTTHPDAMAERWGMDPAGEDFTRMKGGLTMLMQTAVDAASTE